MASADREEAPRYAALLATGRWRPLPGCPGRMVWRGDRAVTPDGLAGPYARVEVFEVRSARDPVHVVALADGGLISYRRADGVYVHTLNTPEGFARKLRELEIELNQPSDPGDPGDRDRA